MPADRETLRALVARVAEFHVTERRLRQAQRDVEAGLKEEDRLGDDVVARYLREVRRYFSGFEREARTHLRDVDRRIEQVNQVHFNLTAERGVAVRRIEATASMLDEIARLTDAPR